MSVPTLAAPSTRRDTAALTIHDRAASWGVGLGVMLLYVLTFASVPTSDGLSFLSMVDTAIASDGKRMPIISNAPFSYFLAFYLKWVFVAARVDVPTLWIFQGLNALVSGLGAVAFYRAIRFFGGAPFWAFTGTMLVMCSYGVWYFANGEVHHVALAILMVMFYRLTVLRQRIDGPSPYGTLVALGLLNAVAVFFHQEHFLFGLVGVALLMVGRPWRRGLRESIVFGAAGSAWTLLFIYLVGRVLAGAHTLRDVVAWYFWQIGYLVREYEPEPLRVIAARLVKGELTAFLYGVQVVADAARDRSLLQIGVVKILVLLALLALALIAVLAATLWRERHRIVGDLRALTVSAFVWLLVYPVLLAWYFPAITEYYLKTVPPLVLLLVVGPIARERGGLPARRSRLIAAALLALVVGINGASAIVPWYRYGHARASLEAWATTAFEPGDLAISIESGIDPVLDGRIDQLHVKDLLYEQGKRRSFERVVSEIDGRLASGHRVFVYNLLPSRWALEGLNAPTRNPYRDTYATGDFEGFLGELRARYELVPVRDYWEESREPLYLFGRQLQAIVEVRRRG